MATEQFMASNVKCGGCVANIQKGVGAIAGVQSVEVELKTGQVVVSGDALNRAELAKKLKELGYPEKS